MDGQARKMSLSSPNVLRGDVVARPFAALLPTVNPSDLQVAVRREGRGARTANEIEQLKQTSMNAGYDEGYARGVEIGMAEGHAKAFADAYAASKAEADIQNTTILDNFASDLEQTVASVLSAMEEWTLLTEEKITNIVVDVCRKVLVSELTQSRDSILTIVQAAMREVTLSESARIRINPEDMPALRDRQGEIIAAAQSVRAIEFVEDGSILGGCVIETDGGIVDATIEGKLDRLSEELEDAA